jgi:hypothetical protein
VSRDLSGIKRGRLSEGELERVTSLAERGFKSGRIAQLLNRHPATVNYAMHRLGLRTVMLREFDYIRNGVRVKSFSRDEDALIVALRVQSYPVETIAKVVSKRFGHPRTAHTVNIRLVLLSNSEAA